MCFLQPSTTGASGIEPAVTRSTHYSDTSCTVTTNSLFACWPLLSSTDCQEGSPPVCDPIQQTPSRSYCWPSSQQARSHADVAWSDPLCGRAAAEGAR
jgi:hypothetical protein